MNRRGDSRSTRVIALLTAALAVALVVAPAAGAAEPAAADEYTLEIPGSRDAALAGPGVGRGTEAASPTDQAGVAGETSPATPSPLGALGSTVAAPVGLFLAALLIVACAAIAAPRLLPPRAR